MRGALGCCRRRPGEPWILVPAEDEDTIDPANPRRRRGLRLPRYCVNRQYHLWLPEAPDNLGHGTLNFTRWVLRLLSLRRAQLRFHAWGQGLQRLPDQSDLRDVVRKRLHHYPGYGHSPSHAG